MQRLPAVCLVALEHVFGEGNVGVSFDREMWFVVVQDDEGCRGFCVPAREQASEEMPSSKQPSLSDHVNVVVEGALAGLRRIEEPTNVAYPSPCRRRSKCPGQAAQS